IFRILDSAQIHYENCGHKFNCIVPSKYFNRSEEKSLRITTNPEKIPFRDGLEIQVINSTTWFLTLMANHSDVTIQFNWGNTTMLACDKSTEIGEDFFPTPDSNITTIRNASRTYIDDNGEEVPGLACKYKSVRRDNVTDRTMAVIFGTLVEMSPAEKMCFKVSGAVNEEYCNFVDDLRPQLQLTFNPLNCSGCTIGPDVCTDAFLCMAEISASQKSARQTADGTGCEYFHNTNHLLVNNE
ncbi:hypothetical protein PENTCL1PPCAC_21948, partial [Pristionchus entomophagus]